MKKGATKTSGILTLILYFLLLVVSVFAVGNALQVEALQKIVTSNEMLLNIFNIVSFPFISFPQLLVMKFMPEIDLELFETIVKVIAIVFAVFSAYMIFWGIKEITLTKKDDARFARCKKTCGFMMFIKIMLFLYFVAAAACCFVIEEIKAILPFLYENEMMPVIACGVLAVYSFIIFILPIINFSKAAKAFNGDPNAQYNADPNAQYGANGQYIDPNGGYYDPNGQQYAAQPTMQANMPPMPGYQPQYQQPAPGQPQPIYSNEPPPQPSIQSQFNPQVQAQEQQFANSIQPGQNGVPLNITPKGIADLERLERLRNSGAITEENYVAMRTKICNTNLS